MTEFSATALRPLSPADTAAIQRIYSPRAVRYLPRPAMTDEQQAVRWLDLAMTLQRAVPWQRMTWGITCGPDLIGIIRLDRRTFRVSKGQSAALSYILSQDNWGQGHATRAVNAVIDRAFGSLGLTAVRARHHPANTVSGKVLTNAGFIRTSAGDADVCYTLACSSARGVVKLPEQTGLPAAHGGLR